MHTSRCNDTPALSPISRRAQRSESATMTNLLTPSRCNSSMLSSTCITPLRKTPKYSLSRPLSTGFVKNTSSNIHFNSNSTFYIPSKVEKSPPMNNTVNDLTTTHQAKYSRPGLFPVVHVFQKKIPIITPKQNSCVIKLSSNGPGLFDDPVSYESQSIVNSTQSSESSTRSVLDALKEISRKRIHGTDSFDMEKTSEYSKRNREEDTSISPKTGQNSPKQAPKRICVVDPIYASNTSSFCLKNNKRKLYECWLPTNENKNKKVMSVETQTPTAASDGIKATKEASEECVSKSTTPFEAKLPDISKSTLDNDSDKTKKSLLDIDEQDDEISETAASAQRAWDEKIYAIQKKNKLALVLSRITGEEPRLIPVPRLWDKTNDVTDTSTNDKSSKLINEVTLTSSGPLIGDNLTNVSVNLCSSGTSTMSTSSNTSKTSTVMPSITTFSTPVNSSSNEVPVMKVTQVLLPTKESPSVVSLSSTSGSVTSIFTTSTLSSASTGFAFDAAKPNNSEVKSTTTNALTCTLPPSVAAKAPVTTTQETTKSTLSLGGLNNENKAGESLIPVALQNGSINMPVSSKPVANESFVLPAKSTSPPTTVSTFTPSTLLEPVNTTVSSTGLAWKNPISQSKSQAFIASGGSSSISKTPIAFGVSGNQVFGSSSKPDTVSFETAFGLKHPSTTVSQKSSSSNTGLTPNTATVSSVTSIASSGFSFAKSDEAAKPAALPASTTGNIFGCETHQLNTPVTTIAAGFVTSAFSANKSQANLIFGTNTSNSTVAFGSTFGNTSVAGQTQSISFSNPMTSSPTKTLGSGFATTPVCGTSTSLAFGTSTSKFGSLSTSVGFGTGSAASTTTTTTFGGFGSVVSSTTQKPSVFGSAALDAKSTFNKPSASTAVGGSAFSFSSSNPPSYAASIGTNSVTSSSSGFGSSASNAGSSTSSFGFGIPAAVQPVTVFGNTSNNINPTGFGATTTSTFGAPANTPAVFGFGNNKASTGFGAPSAGGAGFNSGNAGVASTGSGSSFGQGASSTGDGVFSFGSNTTTTNSTFPFGSSTTVTTTASFGSNSFGSSTNAFASTATSQPSGFGSTPNVNPFGKSTVASFGSTSIASPASSVFGAAGSQTTIGFGATPSTFNTSVPMGNPSSFGSSANPTNFNSSFGSAAGAGSASFSFGPSSAPGFGSNNQAPAFGNNASGFSFKAPGADAQKGVFAFGSSEQPKAVSGGFNFVAGAVQSPTSNFSASFGATPVQQAGTFNIGSGVSSNPAAKRAQLRAKRRT